MDIYDQATDKEEKDRAIALQVRRPTLKPIGYCHNCSDSVHSELLFCSTDCRDDWEKFARMKERAGE